MSQATKEKIKRPEFDIEEEFHDTQRPDKKPSEPSRTTQVKSPASNKDQFRKADGVKKI